MPPNVTPPMTQPGKALVMGDDTRSFLATVRSLGRRGVEVHAAPFNMRAPALSSKYIRQTHLLPFYLDGGREWLAATQKLLQSQQFDLVIPCEERSLLPLFKHQHELPAGCKLALPSAHALDVFFDKLKTRQLAAELGVPTAKGRAVLGSDTTDTVLAALSLPLIAKQRQSYSWPELYIRTSVKTLRNRSELDSYLASIDKGSDGILFEEMFPGRGLGVSVLCHQGEVLQAFEHHRAHELSGSSYYRKSAPLDARRLAAVASMVKAVGYTGVAMFEFKLNEATGEWILLEVNARPWGSLPLPVAAGVDLPFYWYQLLVKGEVAPRQSYQPSVYARNLIPDLWQLRARLQDLAPNKSRQLAHLLGWAGEFYRVVLGREHQDALVLDDPRPGWVEIKQFYTEHFGARPSSGAVHRPQTSLPLARRVQAAQAPGKPAHLVFVCQGNICRSPYAEIKAKQLFAGQAEHITFSSAGMLPRNHRPSPAAAIAAAAQMGVDMLPHRSQHAHEALVREATAILIFDSINLNSLLDRYPAMHDKVYFLSDQVEVSDPEGTSVANFVATYQQIDSHLALLQASWVNASKP